MNGILGGSVSFLYFSKADNAIPTCITNLNGEVKLHNSEESRKGEMNLIQLQSRIQIREDLLMKTSAMHAYNYT
jgi:hypothetical protein